VRDRFHASSEAGVAIGGRARAWLRANFDATRSGTQFAGFAGYGVRGISVHQPMPFARGISPRARRWERQCTKSTRDVDGFIYASRLTGDDCIAVFDRAVEKFAVADACEIEGGTWNCRRCWSGIRLCW